MLISIIKRYDDYVKLGNKLITMHYKLEISPLVAWIKGKIPKTATIDEYEFKFTFHGMGCRFEFGEVIVDFDYTYSDFIYKGFLVRKLFDFIQCLGFSDWLLETHLKKELDKLEFEGVLIKKQPNDINIYDYYLA